MGAELGHPNRGRRRRRVGFLVGAPRRGQAAEVAGHGRQGFALAAQPVAIPLPRRSHLGVLVALLVQRLGVGGRAVQQLLVGRFRLLVRLGQLLHAVAGRGDRDGNRAKDGDDRARCSTPIAEVRHQLRQLLRRRLHDRLAARHLHREVLHLQAGRAQLLAERPHVPGDAGRLLLDAHLGCGVVAGCLRGEFVARRHQRQVAVVVLDRGVAGFQRRLEDLLVGRELPGARLDLALGRVGGVDPRPQRAVLRRRGGVMRPLLFCG